MPADDQVEQDPEFCQFGSDGGDPVCTRCKEEGEMPNPCPRALELQGDETGCTCCEACAHDCAMSV